MSKTVVVTGASAGIGAAVLRALAAEGHQVIGLARRAELIQSMAEENPEWKLTGLKVDITRDEDIVAAFETIKNKFETIDVLINNAGQMEPTLVTDGNIDVWKKMYDINVFGTGSCIREALKIISDSGSIINVSSVLGQETCSYSGMAVYSSTKHALKVLTLGLRAELCEKRPGIKVTLLNPGLVQTGMSEGFIEHHKDIPYITPEDIAQGVLYVLSTPNFVDVTELTIQHSGEYCK